MVLKHGVLLGLANEQWLAWDGRQLYKPSMPKNRITIVDNRIQPIIRKEIARLTQNRPIWSVTPNSADQEDTNAAELGEMVIRYLWKHLKMDKLRLQALLWSRICCAGFLKIYWDSTIGEKVGVVLRPDGGILTDAQGGVVRENSPEHQLAETMMPGSTTVKQVSQGDIKIEARSPFQMFIDPLAAVFEDAEWVIEESVKSVEYVKRRYGVEVTADTPANPGLIEARMGMVYLPGSAAYKGVKVREYWCKPNSTHPNGKRTVWVLSTAGKKQVSQILEEDNHPFDAMPYVMFSAIQMPGRVWPMSVVDALRGPQTELNKLESQIAENCNRLGNPSILASKQAVQDPEKFAASTTMPGGIIFYDDVGSPNAKPDILQAPPLPEYVVNRIETITQSMEDISGQHEVTSAQVPPGVTAASAINLLQESDNTMIAPDIYDHEEELGKLGRKALKLVGQYYTDSRTIQIGGDNGAWQIFDFRGSQLRDNVNVTAEIGLPQSKAAKQAWMQDMLTFFTQSGHELDPRQLQQFLQDMQVGGADKLIQDFTTSETQANRENVLMVSGAVQGVMPINPQDDDAAHIANHEEFERMPRFFTLPEQVQQAHQAHTDLHRQRLQQQQQQQLENQMALQGQVPPTLTAAALQDQQQLSNLQGLQQIEQQNQQGQQQQQAQAQQQGYQAAGAEQQQRHAEELHQQALRQNEEKHQAGLAISAQQAQAQANLRAQQAQQSQQQPQGGSSGRGNSGPPRAR